jgi:transposase-like protein
MYTSMTPRQFRRRFRNERDCMRYLIKRKWPDGFRCPRCGHDQAWLIPSRRKYQCKACNHQTSLTAHTVFHKTRKPLRDWFWAIFLVATRTTGSSARQLQYDLGISYPTAWSWCHKIRKAMEDRDTSSNLRGMVELDDTYIGGKKKPGKRGRGATGKVPVMVAVESRPKGCGHVALRKGASVTSGHAQAFITTRVKNDTIMFSDGFSSYQSLSQDLTLYPLTAGSGQRAVEIFPDVASGNRPTQDLDSGNP